MNESNTVRIELFVGADGCEGGGCPQVFRTNRKSFVVQGNVLDTTISNKMNFPTHEAGVEIPEELLFAVAEKLRESIS
jgi:hypothetical protein